MDEVERVVVALLEAMGFAGTSAVREEVAGQAIISIKAGEHARDLIGQRGDTIHAIDHLVKKIVEQKLSHDKEGAGGESSGAPLYFIDVDDYRARQIRDLEAKAKMMAERARSFQYDVELSPMPAYERLIVHTVLAEEPHVKTESHGEGRNRRVVIKYSTE